MAQKEKSLGLDLTEGSIGKKLFAFTLPFLLANLLNQVYNTVDMIVIGQYVGSVGTVAVSLGGKLSMLFTVLCMGYSSGGQIYIAQQVGAKDKSGINTTIGTLFTFVAVLSLTFAVIGIVFSKPLLSLMNTPEEAYTQSLEYLITTCFGFPFIFGYNAVCAVLRGMGDSKRPLVFIAIAAVANLILDVLFVAVFKMAAFGTALATVIGQLVSFVAAVIFLYKNKERFGFDFKRSSFKIDKTAFKILSKLGIPMALQMGIINITQIYMSSFVNAYGLIECAAYNVAEKIYSFANIVASSINHASGSMIGQNLGAKNHERAKKVVYITLAFSMVIAAVNSVAVLAFPHQLFSLFNNEEAVVAYAVPFMRISCLTFFLSGLMGPLNAMVTGSGFAMLGMIGGLLDGVVFRIGFSFLFGLAFDMGVLGFYLGNSLARLGPIIIGGVYFLSGKWKTHELLKRK